MTLPPSATSPPPLLSLATSCLYHRPLRAVLRVAARAGFDGVELVMSPATWALPPRRMGAEARRWGLRIFSVHYTTLGACPRGRGPRTLEEAVGAALALGCPRVVTHFPLLAPGRILGDSRWLRALERCRRWTRGSGTRLSLENQGTYQGQDPGGYLRRFSRFQEVARRLDLAVTLDTCHLGSAGRLLPELLTRVIPRLINVHLSDYRQQWHARLPLVGSFMGQHLVPGDGQLPLAAFLSRLATAGYGGPLTLEIGPLSLGVHSPAAVRRNLARGVAFTRRHFRAHGESE